jgi:hypothetical protein
VPLCPDGALPVFRAREGIERVRPPARHRRSGITVKTRWEVIEFQAPQRFEILITGFGYTLQEAIVLVAVDGGTRVSIEDVLLPTSLVGRLIVVASGGFVRKDLQARLAQQRMRGTPAGRARAERSGYRPGSPRWP